MMRRHATPDFWIAMCVLGVIPSIARADTKLWQFDSSGVFSDPANWSGGVPGTADLAYFRIFTANPVPYTVTFPGQTIQQPPAAYASGALRVGPNSVTFAQSTQPLLGPATYTLNSTIEIGETSSVPSVLTTTLQSLSSPKATVGLFTGNDATLNVNAGTFGVTGSLADYDLIVGDEGSGTINVSGGAQISVSGAEGNAVLGASAGITGTVNVSDAGSVWNNASNDAAASLDIGGLGSGLLNIMGGGQVNDFESIIASQAGSSGSVMLSGVGSAWTNRGELIVGGDSTGMLTIANGGQVSDGSSIIASGPSATGTVSVTGAGSTWIQATELRIGGNVSLNGSSASGALHISAGGQVNTGGDADVGSVGQATATVDGSGAKWTVGGTLAVNDTGSLSITGGAFVSAGAATDQGTISVGGTGAAWNVNDDILVSGPLNLGTPTIAMASVGNGAHVTNRVTIVGSNRGSGQVFVDGAGSTWSTTEELYIGLDGGGQFNITGGAQVNSGTVQLGVSPGSAGTATVDASFWTSTNDIDVGIVGTATLSVTNGGIVTAAGVVSIGPPGTLQGNSHVAAKVRNGGTVAPGLNPAPMPSNMIATLQVDGDYTQTSTGELDIQLGSAASFDKLIVGGSATLGGTLSVSLLNGFTPAVGNSFDLFTAAGGITGMFSQVDLPSLIGGIHRPIWTLIYSNTDVVLELINSPIGDYNHNGVVDAADYTVWRDSLGKTGIGLAADGDNNHVVDVADYNIWKSNFGLTAGSGGAASDPVPEPSTLLMLAAGIMTFCPCRRPKVLNLVSRDICRQPTVFETAPDLSKSAARTDR
jgi:T5SS/PEP-CTERM-associated repeat protein